MTAFIGIDPGVTGAIAVISDTDVLFATLGREPYELSQAFEIIDTDISFACIERVGAMPKQGVTGAFAFGKVAGMATMLLYQVCKIKQAPYAEIRPQEWQKTILDSDLKRLKAKVKSVHQVNRLFPSLNLKRSQHDVADAICLALYARKLFRDRSTHSS